MGAEGDEGQSKSRHIWFSLQKAELRRAPVHVGVARPKEGSIAPSWERGSALDRGLTELDVRSGTGWPTA